jgi:hypothetical protein
MAGRCFGDGLHDGRLPLMVEAVACREFREKLQKIHAN